MSKSPSFRERLIAALESLVKPGFPNITDILRRRRQTTEDFLRSKSVTKSNALDFLTGLQKDQISYDTDFARAFEVFCDMEPDQEVKDTIDQLLEEHAPVGPRKKASKASKASPATPIDEEIPDDEEKNIV